VSNTDTEKQETAAVLKSQSYPSNDSTVSSTNCSKVTKEKYI